MDIEVEAEEVKTEETRKPRKRRVVKWLVILVVFIGVGGAIGYQYLLPAIDKVKEDLSSITVAEYNPTKENPRPQAPLIPLPEPIEDIAEPAASAPPLLMPIPIDVPPPPPPPEPPKDVNNIQPIPLPVPPPVPTTELETLRANQKFFTLYLAARDLRDARDNPEKFTQELYYFATITRDIPELAGKVHMLELAEDENLPTTSSLKSDLHKLAEDYEEANQQGFWDGVGRSLGKLVKVTKIDAAAEGDSGYAIAKRAEIALDNNNIVKAIAEVQKFGKPGEIWLRRAGNLQRVYEITDFFVVYSRNNIKL